MRVMGADHLADFAEFWSIYPRKVAKDYAYKHYQKALKKTSSARILEGARQYAQAQAGKDLQFTAHPATWLSHGRWSDYDVLAPIAPPPSTGFYAGFGSAEQDAWDAYARVNGKMNYPRDKRGGWRFPSRYPPGYIPSNSTTSGIESERTGT